MERVHSHRRGFLARLAGAAAGLMAIDGIAPAAARQAATQDPDKWMDGLTGKHRCLFDFPGHGDGLPQIHMLNYINTYKSAYGVANSDVNAIGTFYGPPVATASMPLAWNDAMWQKYKIGEALKLTDAATKAPAVRNMFYRPKAGDPIILSGAPAGSIESLQKMGATFLMCNNAFMFWVGWLAGKGMGKAEDIDKEIRANLLPGVITVPAMVIAIEKVQGRGVAYNRQ